MAGEYAVVEPGHHAIVVAVDRRVRVRVSAAGRERSGHIRSDQYQHLPLTWHREGPGRLVAPEHSPYDYVLAGIVAVEEAARARGLEDLPLFDVDIASELDDASGRKFGLGSSAAVVCATVRALGHFYGLRLGAREALRLALAASAAVEPSGSGGDVAASMCGGWIEYASPDRRWLRTERRRRGLPALLGEAWPGLALRRLPTPAGLRLLVGWTGKVASTPRLVGDVRAHARGERADYARFLADSEACVGSLARAIRHEDAAGVRAGIERNRMLLAGLAAHTGVDIETPALRRLAEVARAHGGAAKSSGAGAGDCGIALVDAAADVDAIRREWAAGGIRMLDLAPALTPPGSRGGG